MRKFLLYLSFLFLYLLIPLQSFASSEFITDYDVSYTVTNNSNTNVKINISLTNTSDVYYASSYKIQLGFGDIKNIRAFDSGGPIVPTINKKEDTQTIDLTFNNRVIGKGNKLNFTLSFDTKEIARKVGNVWEVNVPGIAKQSDFSSFNVHVIVPQGFGKPSYIKPNLTKVSGSSNIYNFSKDELGRSGISISFGNEQIYSFSLVYHLYNNHLFPIETEIALPPSTNYQDISIENISPKPLSVTTDKDGNWLAQYKMSPSQKFDIKVSGKARVRLIPKTENFTQDELKNYLKDRPYWQASNQEIKNIASSLKTPSAIYDFVVKKLSYDYTRVTSGKPRLGALEALHNPNSAVCLEFTDLFIAIARAAGIPAREVDGYAYTQNSKERPLSLVKDILHAWPEYYDNEKKAWIMIDPTWGNTTGGIDYFNTLDFDHLAFVIKGEDSDYPVPAGGYKTQSDKDTKDVEVSFADKFEATNPVIQIIQDIPDNIISGLPVKAIIDIKNTGTISTSDEQIIVNAGILAPSFQKITIKKIPPYGEVKIPLNFEKTSPLTNKENTIKITIAGNTIYHKIKISPFFLNAWFFLGGGIIVASTVILYIIARKFRNIHFLRQKG